MTGYQSKKKSRHADEITLDHLIKLRVENEQLREALKLARDELDRRRKNAEEERKKTDV